MKLDGTAPSQGPEGRRFQAAKSLPAKEGGKSFGALLKKASEAKPAPAPTPHTAPASTAASAQATSAPAASTSGSSAPSVSAAKTADAKSASKPAAFSDHMEMVKLRLKSGYYNNSNVNDALSEKLTGFFDDLA